MASVCKRSAPPEYHNAYSTLTQRDTVADRVAAGWMFRRPSDRQFAFQELLARMRTAAPPGRYSWQRWLVADFAADMVNHWPIVAISRIAERWAEYAPLNV